MNKKKVQKCSNSVAILHRCYFRHPNIDINVDIYFSKMSCILKWKYIPT